MRLTLCAISICVAALPLLGGCPGTNQGDPLPLVAGTSESIDPIADDVESPAPVVDAEPESPTTPGSYSATGNVSGQGDYELFALGAAQPGDKWTITAEDRDAFLVVLLDEQYELLYRERVSRSASLEHIIRQATSDVFLGVAPAYGDAGGNYDLFVRREPAATIPAPAQQVVYLNFAGGSDVRIHGEHPISFGAFDAALLGDRYAGATDFIKQEAVAAMRADYSDFNVVLMTSDEGPPPEGPHATVHFGGNDSRLLGLADSVDQYNADPWQAAIIYVEAFTYFDVMQLADDEIAQLLGNVASHELGHLLGLFHTQVPEDLMDTTGTAWDLVQDQSFAGGALEASVFPIGFENPELRLAETVGYSAARRQEDVTRPVVTEKMARKALLRKMVEQELHCRCGNCLNPD